MGKFTCLYTLMETQYSKDGDGLVPEILYERNLPHGKEFVKEAISSWNELEDLFLDMLNKDLKLNYGEKTTKKIISCKMKQYKPKSEESILAVEFITDNKTRMTEPIREICDEFFSAQASDGWGEGFFYPGYTIKIENDMYASPM